MHGVENWFEAEVVLNPDGFKKLSLKLRRRRRWRRRRRRRRRSKSPGRKPAYSGMSIEEVGIIIIAVISCPHVSK